jgi:hypothetical protein
VSEIELRGSFHVESGTWPRLLQHFAVVIPEYPGELVIKVARIPPPPKLDRADDAGMRAFVLAVAHSKVVAHRYEHHRRVTVDRKNPPAHLVDTAAALIEAGIPPIAWCAFMDDEWRRWTTHDESVAKLRNKPPQATWTCRAKEVQDRRGRYESSASLYQGGQLCVGTAHRKLLEMWSRLQLNLLRAAPDDLRSVQREVHRVFPGDLYDRLVAQSVREATDMQELLNKQAARGVYLWA